MLLEKGIVLPETNRKEINDNTELLHIMRSEDLGEFRRIIYIVWTIEIIKNADSKNFADTKML